MKSEISHTSGGTTFSGPAAVDVFRAYVIASALEMYGRHKIKANRAYTPTAMLDAVQSMTGMRFKRTQMVEAAQYLRTWANAKRAEIPETREVNHGS